MQPVAGPEADAETEHLRREHEEPAVGAGVVQMDQRLEHAPGGSPGEPGAPGDVGERHRVLGLGEGLEHFEPVGQRPDELLLVRGFRGGRGLLRRIGALGGRAVRCAGVFHVMSLYLPVSGATMHAPLDVIRITAV